MIDHNTTEWTPDELASLPQIDKVFDAPLLVMDSHDWQQQGYTIIDVCDPRTALCMETGLSVPSGKLLIKTKKGYDLVDELR